MGPDTLREEAESLRTDPRGLGVYAGRVRAHADAWELKEAALTAAIAENADLYRRVEAIAAQAYICLDLGIVTLSEVRAIYALAAGKDK